jgi:hypothetical protein
MRTLVAVALLVSSGCLRHDTPFDCHLLSAVGTPLSTPIAVGASVGISCAPQTVVLTQPVLELVPSPSIFVPTKLRALQTGTTSIELRSGDLVARGTAVVEAPDALEFVNGWGSAPGPTMLVGVSGQRFWVRPSRAGHLLAGNGATTFSYSGPLASTGEVFVPFDSIPDSEENFAQGTAAGMGTITAHAGAATASVPVTLVGLTAIDSGQAVVEHPANEPGCVRVKMTGFAGTTAVFGGARCDWGAVPFQTDAACVAPAAAPGFLDAGGWTGNTPTVCYKLCAPIPAQATCTLVSGVQVNVTLN